MMFILGTFFLTIIFYSLWHSIRCRHVFKFKANIYGDAINIADGNRSIWECTKCGGWEYRPELHKFEPMYSNLLKTSVASSKEHTNMPPEQTQ